MEDSAEEAQREDEETVGGAGHEERANEVREGAKGGEEAVMFKTRPDREGEGEIKGVCAEPDRKLSERRCRSGGGNDKKEEDGSVGWDKTAEGREDEKDDWGNEEIDWEQTEEKNEEVGSQEFEEARGGAVEEAKRDSELREGECCNA